MPRTAADPVLFPDTTAVPITWVPLATVRPHPRNDGTHPPDELAHLKQSLQEHGVYRNVVIAEDGTILAGHGVVEAAKQLGHTQILARRMPYGPDDPQALKILVGDNHIARLRMQDDAALVALLLDLRQQDEALLLGTGFDQAALDVLIAATRPPEPPEAFPAYGEDILVEHTCPRCGYQWSGGRSTEE